MGYNNHVCVFYNKKCFIIIILFLILYYGNNYVIFDGWILVMFFYINLQKILNI